MSYKNNARWLIGFAPFRSLSISAAYLTPFFLQNEISTSQIFLLQSIFSVAYLLWEIPSGIIADRFGRALSIKVSAPIAGVAMIAYGQSTEFWQFVVCELVLAVANGLISGVDTALLHDSLAAQKREKDFVKISQRISALGYASTAVAVPIAMGVVAVLGLGATLVADGLITLAGLWFALRLTEAPQQSSTESQRESAWSALTTLAKNKTAGWLIILRAALSTATYLAFWLAALYYEQLGIPVVWFGAILAGRSLLKAWASHRFHHTGNVRRVMGIYAVLTGAVYLAMASQQLWLVWVIVGHDIVQALATWPLNDRLNGHMNAERRATMNSMANLVQRIIYAISGPLIGLIVDKAGLQMGLMTAGLGFSAIACVAVWQLNLRKSLD